MNVSRSRTAATGFPRLGLVPWRLLAVALLIAAPAGFVHAQPARPAGGPGPASSPPAKPAKNLGSMPSRFYLLDGRGRVAYKSGRGPFGFKPAELEHSLILLLQDEFPDLKGKDSSASSARKPEGSRSARDNPPATAARVIRPDSRP